MQRRWKQAIEKHGHSSIRCSLSCSAEMICDIRREKVNVKSEHFKPLKAAMLLISSNVRRGKVNCAHTKAKCDEHILERLWWCYLLCKSMVHILLISVWKCFTKPHWLTKQLWNFWHYFAGRCRADARFREPSQCAVQEIQDSRPYTCDSTWLGEGQPWHNLSRWGNAHK